MYFLEVCMRDEILRRLKGKEFRHLVHAESDPRLIAQEVGIDVSKGLKCLVVKGKKSGKNYLVCVQGHKRVDMKAVAGVVGENCEFEAREVIRERYGLEVGGIPPFLELDVFFDSDIASCDEVIFSCGLVNESIVMKLKDLVALILPRFVKVT